MARVVAGRRRAPATSDLRPVPSAISAATGMTPRFVDDGPRLGRVGVGRVAAVVPSGGTRPDRYVAMCS
ncbi:hypothetical protein FAIPA1_20222 [Frankia sp. AiPs1]